VPLGTVAIDELNDVLLGDVTEHGQHLLVARGGRGGLGNVHFKSSTNRAPRKCTPGQPGEEIQLHLELKVLADVGLLGFPNAGKSTLISVISSAKPKIADYPFTTLEPNLGIVYYKDYKSFTVADIPGIIEGAHEGKGLGLKFLRHIERTKILLFLIEITSENIERDYKILLNELKQYSKKLADRKKIIALSKSDLLDKKSLETITRKKLFKQDIPIVTISSATNEGIQEMLDRIWELLNNSY